MRRALLLPVLVLAACSMNKSPMLLIYPDAAAPADAGTVDADPPPPGSDAVSIDAALGDALTAPDGTLATDAGLEASLVQNDAAPPQSDAAPQSDAVMGCSPDIDAGVSPGCPTGQHCYANHCYIPGSCSSNDECPAQASGQICFQGRCSCAGPCAGCMGPCRAHEACVYDGVNDLCEAGY